MTLFSDRPNFIRWESGLSSEFLEEIGKMAVTTAKIELLLHQLYWKCLGIDEARGPRVTDNLTPKRLSEDILAFLKGDASKAKVYADLKMLLVAWEKLNTSRNQCLHWIWSIQPAAQGGPPPPYLLTRPQYKISGVNAQTFNAGTLLTLNNDLAWLEVRLQAHAMPEEELRAARAIKTRSGFLGAGQDYVDLFYPAPWLDEDQSSDPSSK